MITTIPTVRGSVQVADGELFYEQRGHGPDVLLLAGLSDPLESWELQLDGLSDAFRVTAFDNRGAGRSSMIPEDFTVAGFADDAAAVARALGIEHAHVAGFSGGSVTAQELALRHPDLVRSLVLQSTWARLDAFAVAVTETLAWMVEAAPSERAMLEAFFPWIYTAEAHASGFVAAVIDDALAFPHPQSAEAFRRQLATWVAHDSVDRLPEITAPTLVLAGEADLITPARHGRQVADAIPGARFVLQAGAAHQPFQEDPTAWNATVRAFWAEVEGATAPA